MRAGFNVVQAQSGLRLISYLHVDRPDVILLSAEIDASVGPILKTYADSAGVVYSYTDGDEPGVAWLLAGPAERSDLVLATLVLGEVNRAMKEVADADEARVLGVALAELAERAR